MPGKIVKVAGPVSFYVQLEDGRQRKCHQDHLRARVVGEDSLEMAPVTPDESFLSLPSASGDLVGTRGEGSTQPHSTPAEEQPQGSSEASHSDSLSIPSQSTETSTRRYPSRSRRPREIFDPGT